MRATPTARSYALHLLTSLLSILSLVVTPRTTHAQITTTYTGCTVFFCANLTRLDFDDGAPDLPAYHYLVNGTLTLLQPTIDAGYVTFLDGLVYHAWSDTDYEDGMYLPNFDLTGLVAGATLAFDGYGAGRNPAPPFTEIRALLVDATFSGGIVASSSVASLVPMVPMASMASFSVDDVPNATPLVIPLTLHSTPTTVPEPTTLGLAAGGLLVLGATAHRRRVRH